MKKLIRDILLILVVVAGIIITASADTHQSVTKAFHKNFKNALHVTHHYTHNGLIEYNFELDHHHVLAIFKKDGTLLETEIESNKEEIPAQVFGTLNHMYKQYEMCNITKVVCDHGHFFYRARLVENGEVHSLCISPEGLVVVGH